MMRSWRISRREKIGSDFQPFSRCPRCNGLLHEVSKSSIEGTLLPLPRRHFEHFERFAACGRSYWKGSHWTYLTQILNAARLDAGHTPSNDGT
jgi:uncharacterized protein with PIN domain